MPLRRLTSLFHKSHNLRQAVGILFVTVFISNVLGLLRNIIIANRTGLAFGSIGPLDSYYAAFTLPDLLYTLLIVGALSSAILPLLVKLDTEGDDEKFWRTYNVLLSSGLTVVIIGLVVLYFILPWLMGVMFPGFSAEKLTQTIQLAQVLLLSPLFFTISQISTSALQAKRMFFAPALAPIVYNLAIVSGAMLIPRFGLPVLVFGVILGAASHFLVQLPSLLRLGWRFHFETGFKTDEIRQIFRLMIPRTIALTSTQLLLIVFYRLASNFESGAIAIYRLADDLQTAPVLLLANTLAVAILPEFSRRFAKSEHEQFDELIGRAMRLMAYFFAPIVTFLLIFRQEIVGLYISLGHSIKTSELDLAVTTFSYFVISLFFQAGVLILARAHFAKNDTLKPTLITLLSLTLAWFAAAFFSRSLDMGVTGLALAFSLGSIMNATLLWLSLRIPLRNLFYDESSRFNFGQIIFGTVLAGLAFILARLLAPALYDQLIIGRSWQKLIDVTLGLVLGFGVYFLWSRITKIEQWQLIKNRQDSTES